MHMRGSWWPLGTQPGQWGQYNWTSDIKIIERTEFRPVPLSIFFRLLNQTEQKHQLVLMYKRRDIEGDWCRSWLLVIAFAEDASAQSSDACTAACTSPSTKEHGRTQVGHLDCWSGCRSNVLRRTATVAGQQRAGDMASDARGMAGCGEWDLAGGLRCR